jgi:hypothetical protein
VHCNNKMIFNLLIVLTLFGCNSSPDENAIVDIASGSNRVQSISEVEGHWKRVETYRVTDIPSFGIYFDPNAPRIAEEAGPFDGYRGGDLVFEKDTMYRIDYPMELLERSHYTIDDGFIRVDGESYSNFYMAETVGDTLFIYVTGTDGVEYLKESYVRTNLKDSIIDLLKTHTVNYPELAGKWILMREYIYDYGTDYQLIFPYKIPDSLKISREQFVKGQDQSNLFWMSTDGKKRDYYFWYDYPYLHLTPGDWYTGEDPWIHFEPCEP